MYQNDAALEEDQKAEDWWLKLVVSNNVFLR